MNTTTTRVESLLIDNNGQTASNNKHQPETPSRSSFFSEILARLNPSSNGNHRSNALNENEKKQDNNNNNNMIGNHNDRTPSRLEPQHNQAPLPMPKRACRAPSSRRFAHPCTCQSSHHKSFSNINTSSPLPPAAYTIPLHLWDPMTRKCLPTSRNRDMLLKECRPNVANPYSAPQQIYHGAPCVYDDLVCDARRNRCICKPSLHLYYETNLSSFGCVPIGSASSPDGRTSCRSGYIYNVISKECQKIFDVNELPATHATGVSATQFSFVTIVLIWILLLILIVTAKLKKFRSSGLYRNSPTTERRAHQGNSYRNRSQSASAWLHPFIAAVNGHHHLNQHRTTIDRQLTIDESGNYNDTDFFLANGRRVNDLFPENNFAGSQQSLNNPPPKFEEIYPSSPEVSVVPPPPPPSNEDLPSYDEAMKLQTTVPPDRSVNSKE